MNKFDLNTFGNGALLEKANIEIQKVLDNISDPNTDATKERKVKIEISFKPIQNRQGASINISTSTKLQNSTPSETAIIIDKDMKTGKVLAKEIGNQIPGQTSLVEDEDTEESESNNGVIDLRERQ